MKTSALFLVLVLFTLRSPVCNARGLPSAPAGFPTLYSAPLDDPSLDRKGSPEAQARAYEVYAWAAFRTGQSDVAYQSIRAAEGVLRGNRNEGAWRSLELSRGIFLAAEGKLSEASQVFERALRSARQDGSVPQEVATAALALATVHLPSTTPALLSSPDHPGYRGHFERDPMRARDLADEALRETRRDPFSQQEGKEWRFTAEEVEALAWIAKSKALREQGYSRDSQLAAEQGRRMFDEGRVEWAEGSYDRTELDFLAGLFAPEEASPYAPTPTPTAVPTPAATSTPSGFFGVPTPTAPPTPHAPENYIVPSAPSVAAAEKRNAWMRRRMDRMTQAFIYLSSEATATRPE